MTKRNIILIMACWTLLCFTLLCSNGPVYANQTGLYQGSNDCHTNHLDTTSRDTGPAMGMIPDVFVSHTAGDDGAVAIVVEKSSQTLILYDMLQQPDEMFRMSCSTGRNFGPKTVSGDAKTPEGVYFFTREYDDKYLTPVYGVKAFPTDYPNMLDRLAGRTGSAIWLHGTDKPLKPYDSNGCVAVRNADLLALAPFITLNRTPVIIVEKLNYHAKNSVREAMATVSDLLCKWQTALENAAYEDYIACYGDSPPPPEWWGPWEQGREAMLSNHISVMLTAQNIAIYRHRNAFVAVFDQYVKAADTTLWVGTKKFFLENQDGRLAILGDTYQARSDISREYPMENPLIATYRSLEQSLKITPDETNLLSFSEAIPSPGNIASIPAGPVTIVSH